VIKNWNVFARITTLEQEVNKLIDHINQLSAPPSPLADKAYIQRKKAKQKEYARRFYLKRKAELEAKAKK
jgi:hypothetical protein